MSSDRATAPGGLRKHALLWVAVLLGCLVHLRFARILALDCEALLLNFSPDHNMMKPWVMWSWLVIQICGLPLVAVATAALLYRVFGRRLGLRNPLKALALGWRALLGLGIFLGWVASCVPATLGLATWASVEATWWIQWYENVLPITEQIIFKGPIIAGPPLAALGLLLAIVSLKRPREDREDTAPASAGRKVARLLGWVLALVILLSALPVTLLAGLHGSRVALVPGESAFRTRCDKCHERSLALYYVKTPEAWARTVERQRKKDDSGISDAEQKEITKFITGMRGFPDSWTFRARCQRCHGASTWSWEDRDPGEWDTIVDRLARWSPYFYKREVRAQLKRHLRQAHASDGATLGLPADKYQAFHRLARRCGGCHSISRSSGRLANATNAEILALVQRMNQKMIKQLSAKEMEDLAGTYKQLMADPKQFDHLFPHDRPEEDGRLSW